MAIFLFVEWVQYIKVGEQFYKIYGVVDIITNGINDIWMIIKEIMNKN